MHHPRFFMILTFVMLGVTIATVVIHKQEIDARPAARDVDSDGSLADGSSSLLTDGTTGSENGTSSDPSLTSLTDTGPILVTGMRLDVPRFAELPTLTKIPWTRTEAQAAFLKASGQSCRLLEEGMTVSPRLARSTGTERPLGRIPAFTIGIEVDSEARASLPELSKDQIETYLADHRLVIEAPLYADAEGVPFLGADVRAAFFGKDSPNRTIVPEGLVASAVKELRILGVYRSEEESIASPPRTLVLLFRYMREDKELAITSKPTQEFELLFLHLLKSSSNDQPEVVAFATSDRLQSFHQLHQLPVNIPVEASSVTALVRFKEYTNFGLYPSNPTVVDVRLQSRFSLPVTTIRSRLLGSQFEPAIALSELLDDLHNSGEVATSPYKSESL